MKNCSFVSVGPCHQLRFCRNKGLRNVDVEEKEMLQLRSKVPFSEIKTICKHHEQLLDIQFSQWITKCSDPFKKHSTAVTRSLRIISLNYYAKTECLQGKVVPGEKLCLSCRIQAKPETEKSESATQSTAEEPTRVIPCQFTQIWHEDWHDRLGFSWNFVHFLYPMRHVKTRNILILGQVLFEIWVGEFWPDPLDLEPLSVHISACILPGKMIFISFFSFLKALHG